MTTNRSATACIFALVALAAAPVSFGQAVRATPGQPQARTALELIPARGRLVVTSPAFAEHGQIPFENTQYRGNTFPGLAWSRGPRGTRSYVVIMQDASLLVRGAPILHWTMFDIPPAVTRLAAGMGPDARPAGSLYGPNIRGPAHPYMGPRTPPGPGDDYHFAVFALDTELPPAVASDYAALTSAMQGHVLASGEVIGHGIADPDAPPRPGAPPVAAPPHP